MSFVISGAGGNRLEARLSKPSSHPSPHFYCSKTADWFDVWLDVEQLLPGVIDCWTDNIKLLWNGTDETFSNNEGVETRVPCFGEVCGVEYLDTKVEVGGSAYFHAMIEAFAAEGYVRGESIVSAPYDFRYSPVGGTDGYGDRTVKLVEDLCEKNGGEKVLLVSHSMGGLWAHHLLVNQSAAWKEKHVHAWAALAPAYGGTARELRLMASGDNEGVPFAEGSTVREEQRSSESNFWLLPNLSLWGEDEVIIEAPGESYTAHELRTTFWNGIGFPDGNQIYPRLESVFDLSDVGVRTLVKYGVGKDTPERYVYSQNADWDEKFITSVVMGDGDGTVNRRSLEAGLIMEWKGAIHEAFEGEDHQSIIKNEEVLKSLVAEGLGA